MKAIFKASVLLLVFLIHRSLAYERGKFFEHPAVIDSMGINVTINEELIKLPLPESDRNCQVFSPNQNPDFLFVLSRANHEIPFRKLTVFEKLKNESILVFKTQWERNLYFLLHDKELVLIHDFQALQPMNLPGTSQVRQSYRLDADFQMSSPRELVRTPGFKGHLDQLYFQKLYHSKDQYLKTLQKIISNLESSSFLLNPKIRISLLSELYMLQTQEYFDQDQEALFRSGLSNLLARFPMEGPGLSAFVESEALKKYGYKKYRDLRLTQKRNLNSLLRQAGHNDK